MHSKRYTMEEALYPCVKMDAKNVFPQLKVI